MGPWIELYGPTLVEFTIDLVGIRPSNIDKQESRLEPHSHLLRRDIGVLVPGHGPVVYGRDEVRGWLEWEAEYLASVRGRVQELLGDGAATPNPEAVVDAVEYDIFVGSRWPAERHNMPKRHRNTVQKIVEEESTPDG